MSDTRRVPALTASCKICAIRFGRSAATPGFTTFAVLIVGLGIGASATVFSVVDTLLLRPLPFREPERLVWIANRDTSGLSGQTTQVGHLLDLRERNRSFSDLAAYFAFYGVGDNLLSGQRRAGAAQRRARVGEFLPGARAFSRSSAGCSPRTNANGTDPKPCC